MKPQVSGGVEGMIDIIHERKHAEAAKQGKVWCGRWSHAYHLDTQDCIHCWEQDQLGWWFWFIYDSTH